MQILEIFEEGREVATQAHEQPVEHGLFELGTQVHHERAQESQTRAQQSRPLHPKVLRKRGEHGQSHQLGASEGVGPEEQVRVALSTEASREVVQNGFKAETSQLRHRQVASLELAEVPSQIDLVHGNEEEQFGRVRGQPAGEQIVQDVLQSPQSLALFEREGQQHQAVGDDLRVLVDLAEAEGVHGADFGLFPVAQSRAQIRLEQQRLLNTQFVPGIGGFERARNVRVDGRVELLDFALLVEPPLAAHLVVCWLFGAKTATRLAIRVDSAQKPKSTFAGLEARGQAPVVELEVENEGILDHVVLTEEDAAELPFEAQSRQSLILFLRARLRLGLVQTELTRKAIQIGHSRSRRGLGLRGSTALAD